MRTNNINNNNEPSLFQVVRVFPSFCIRNQCSITFSRAKACVAVCEGSSVRLEVLTTASGARPQRKPASQAVVSEAWPCQRRRDITICLRETNPADNSCIYIYILIQPRAVSLYELVPFSHQIFTIRGRSNRYYIQPLSLYSPPKGHLPQPGPETTIVKPILYCKQKTTSPRGENGDGNEDGNEGGGGGGGDIKW